VAQAASTSAQPPAEPFEHQYDGLKITMGEDNPKKRATLSQRAFCGVVVG